MHLLNVGIDGFSKGSGMHVHLENVEDLRKQLLLMQIVKLESCVHSVDDSVLVDKSRKLLHDGLDEAPGVSEVVHNMAARSDLVLPVHAIVESGNTIDVVDLVNSDPSDMGHSLLDSNVSEGLGSSLNSFVALIFFGLDKSERR